MLLLVDSVVCRLLQRGSDYPTSGAVSSQVNGSSEHGLTRFEFPDSTLAPVLCLCEELINLLEVLKAALALGSSIGFLLLADFGHGCLSWSWS